MKTYSIYKYTSPSGKSYIGQTNNIARRKSAHKQMDGSSLAFHSAIEKYGYESFLFEILHGGLTLEEANRIEEECITIHNTISPNGYNLVSGGLNRTPSTETRQKQSIAKLGKKLSETHKNNIKKNMVPYTRTQKHLDRLSQVKSGENSSFYGVSHTEEWKANMSASMIGDKNHFYGKTHTEETKLKISKKSKGRKHSEEDIRKQQDAQNKTWEIIYPDGHIEIIVGLSEFCRNNGLNSGCMRNVAYGRRSHHKGFVCKRLA